MFDDKYDALRLCNQLCFPMYASVRETIKSYRTYLTGLDLTYTQYLAMLAFWEHKKLNVKELGQKLFLDSGTLTPVLKSLESKGLVSRNRSTEDERILNVEITEAGETLKEKALEIPRSMATFTRLDPEETRQLYHLLYKLLGVPEEDIKY